VTNEFQRRMLYLPILHIDTNLINARQKLPAVNQLEKWFEDEVILINMSGTAHQEAQVGNNAQRTAKANRQIFSVSEPARPTDGLFKSVERLLFTAGASSENQRNDVRIVVEAIRYGAILVTGDGGSKSQPGGILGNRDSLWDRHRLRVSSAEEVVKLVREKILERDSFNMKLADRLGRQPPAWTGKD
jgi:hypothetical protein